MLITKKELDPLEAWLTHRKSKQSCGNILDQFRCFVGCDGFGGLLELEDPREAVLRWRDTLELAPKSLNVYMSLVKSFYRHFDVDLGVLPRVRGRVIHPHKVLTLDEIRRMVHHADIRMKALILFLYCSGARISSVLGLDYGRINWRDEPPLKVHFYPSETKFEVEYDTFIADEAVNALLNYFRWRRRRGEQLKPNSPLFVTKYGSRLSYNGSRSAIQTIIGKAGIVIDENERLTHHSFRGAFQHNLQRAGVNQYIIEKIIGHYMETKTVGRTVGRYSRGLTLEDLSEAYTKANWSLEIDEVKVRELETEVMQTKQALGTETMTRQKLVNYYEDKFREYDELLKAKDRGLTEILRRLEVLEKKGN